MNGGAPSAWITSTPSLASSSNKGKYGSTERLNSSVVPCRMLRNSGITSFPWVCSESRVRLNKVFSMRRFAWSRGVIARRQVADRQETPRHAELHIPEHGHNALARYP